MESGRGRVGKAVTQIVWGMRTDPEGKAWHSRTRAGFRCVDQKPVHSSRYLLRVDRYSFMNNNDDEMVLF